MGKRFLTGISALDDVTEKGFPKGELVMLYGRPRRFPRPPLSDIAAQTFWALYMAEDKTLTARERDDWSKRAQAGFRLMGI